MFFNPVGFTQSVSTSGASSRASKPKDILPVSPNAGGLGSFGSVPIGHFKGTVDVSVPIYDVGYKDLSINLTLKYQNSSGNKPDLLPGSVGMGWVLLSGGSIVRSVKVLSGNQASGDIPLPVVTNPTAASDWSSSAKMNSYLSNNIDFFESGESIKNDEFYFSINGMSGRIYTDHNGEFKVRSTNGGKLTIETLILPNKNISVPSLSQTERYYPANPPYAKSWYEAVIPKTNLLYKFVLTDDKGVRYTFGGTDESIEFSRPGQSYGAGDEHLPEKIVATSWQLTSIESPNGYRIALQYRRGNIVTSKVSYSDITINSWQNGGPSTGLVNAIDAAPVARAEKATLINPSYLDKIITPAETILFYGTVASNQLSFPPDQEFTVAGGPDETTFEDYKDIAWGKTYNRFPEKLDSIVVKDFGDKRSMKVNFNYTDNALTRLKLKSVRFLGKNNLEQNVPVYSFDYNSTPLPEYLSFKTDHYGFYNGRNTFVISKNPADYTYLRTNVSAQNNYSASRESVLEYLGAESLIKITYPTGGYTKFQYELNDYGSTATKWPFGVVENVNQQAISTGGLRIKKISNFGADDKKVSEKTLFYVKNYATGGTASSGVLSYKPFYFEKFSGTVTPPAARAASTNWYKGTIDYWRWSTNPILEMDPLSEGHVTYSEVTEVLHSDTLTNHNTDLDAYTVYKYKNYDNGYNDVAPLSYVSDHSAGIYDESGTVLKRFWTKDPGTSMGLERGQILSESYYQPGRLALKLPKREILYQYNDSLSRFEDNVRLLRKNFTNLHTFSYILSTFFTANLIYTYDPYLKKKTVVDYYGNNMVTDVTNYVYDKQYRVLKEETSTESNGDVIKTISRYPQDKSLTGNVFSEMKNRKMTGVVVEKEIQVNNVKQRLDSKTFTSGYGTDASLIPLPAYSTMVLPETEMQQIRLANPVVILKYLKYDDRGNILCLSKENGTKVSYIYSFDKLLPVAKIENADYDLLVEVLGAVPLKNFNKSLTPDMNFLNVLRTDSRMNAAQVTTYTYGAMRKVVRITDGRNYSTYFEYDGQHRLMNIKDNGKNIIKSYCYNFKGQPVDCSFLQPLKYSAGFSLNKSFCGPVETEEVMVYPNKPLSAILEDTLEEEPEDAKVFYDAQLTQPVQTGYYTFHEYLDGKIKYFYIDNGRVIYKNLCGDTDPYVLRYSPTLLANQQMCLASLPAFAAFCNGLPVTGRTLFVDRGLSVVVPNGYYQYNGSYFQVTNGVIGEIITCVPVGGTSVSHQAMYSSNLVSHICAQDLPVLTVYTSNATIAVGNLVYVNQELTTKAADGYYVFGSKYFRVINGAVTLLTNCPGDGEEEPEPVDEAIDEP